MRALVGAALMALSANIVGCGNLIDSPDEAIGITDLELEARPWNGEVPDAGVTDPIEVASGRITGGKFHLVVYRSGRGPCKYTASPAGTGSGCGAMPGEGVVGGPAFGMTGVTAGGPSGITEVNGLVDSEVARVLVDTSETESVEAVIVDLAAAEIAASAFIAFVPGGSQPSAVIALDDEGEVIERFVFHFRDFGGDAGPPPAPGES